MTNSTVQPSRTPPTPGLLRLGHSPTGRDAGPLVGRNDSPQAEAASGARFYSPCTAKP